MASEPDPREVFEALQAEQERMTAQRTAELEEMMADLRGSILGGHADGDLLRLYETLAVEKALLDALMRNGRETLRLMARAEGF